MGVSVVLTVPQTLRNARICTYSLRRGQTSSSLEQDDDARCDDKTEHVPDCVTVHSTALYFATIPFLTSLAAHKPVVTYEHDLENPGLQRTSYVKGEVIFGFKICYRKNERITKRRIDSSVHKFHLRNY